MLGENIKNIKIRLLNSKCYQSTQFSNEVSTETLEFGSFSIPLEKNMNYLENLMKVGYELEIYYHQEYNFLTTKVLSLKPKTLILNLTPYHIIVNSPLQQM